MAFTIKLPANGRVVINGCLIRNAPRTQSFTVENTADILLETHMVTRAEADRSLSAAAAFKIQAALIAPERRAHLLPDIDAALATLSSAFPGQHRAAVEAARAEVSRGQFFKAMRNLTPVRAYEASLGAIAPPSPDVMSE